MKNFSRKIALALMGATILLTGCYREEISEIKKEIGEINISSLEAQVSEVKSSVASLESLKSQISPALDTLMSAKSRMESQLAEEKKKSDATAETSTESKAKIISLETQIAAIEAAIAQLSDANLDARIKELNEYVSKTSEDLDGRLGNLEEKTKETARLAQQSLDELAKLQAALDIASGGFDDKFEEVLLRNKESIVQWVSKSKIITDLFGSYYTKEKVADMLSEIDLYNYFQEREIEELYDGIKELEGNVPAAIEEAINGVKRGYDQKISAINATTALLDSTYKSLDARVTALEKLPAVIGDYSNYKGTLVQDILDLQARVGKESEDGTLTALVNTLKLLLTDSEGNYYDLAKIVDDIAANKGEIGSQDLRIKAIEDLVPTFASLEKLNELKDKVGKLEGDVKDNRVEIDTLVKRVDAIVAQWTDAVLNQIKTNASDIVKLKAEDTNLWLAIGSDGTDGQAKGGILGLIADINNKIAELKVEELWKDVETINTTLENCGVDGIKGLQANMDSFDARIKAIWEMLGNPTDLFMEGTLVSAINYINAKFGGIGDTTVDALIKALQSDIAIIKGEGWISGVDLSTLNAALTQLKSDLELKADVSTVDGIKSDVEEIQNTLLTLITTEDVNTKLEDYLLSATAADTYATITALTTFQDTFNALVGDKSNPAEGTVLARLAKLENAVGDGSFTDNWTTNLTAAVNTLHGLVGNQSVEHQADSIAASIVNSLVSTILGKEGTTEALATELKTFITEVRALSVTIGETTYDHTNLDDAIKAVYDILTTYVGDYNSALTSDVTSTTFTSLADRFKAIEDAIGYNEDSTALFFTTANTIAAAITNINAMIGAVDLEGGETLAGLITTLQGTYGNLVNALFGEGGIPDDASLYNNLNQLKDRLDTLGFTDIHGTDKDGNAITLKTELDKLNASIESIEGRIGTGFSKDSTIVMALNQFKAQLGEFTNAKYLATVSEITGDIDKLINALCGLSSGGTIEGVQAMRKKFEELANLFDKVTVNSKTGLLNILDDFDARLKQLNAWIGDPNGDPNKTDDNLGKLADEIRALQKKIDSEEYLQRIADLIDTDALAERLGITELETRIGNLEDLKTTAKGSLVAAINELWKSLDDCKLDKSEIEKLRKEIIGDVIEGNEITYNTIAALSQAIVNLNEQLGEKPEDWGERGSLYIAIMNMETSLSNILGKNNTDYKTVWEAIEDIKKRIKEQSGDDSSKGLNELLYSCTYIPEYADGKAQLSCTPGRTAYGTIVMKFQIDASPAFYTNWTENKYVVKGLCKSLKTRADYENTLEATASLSGKILTVSMSGTQLKNLPSTGDAMVAVSISDSEGKESFTTPFVILLFKTITSDKALTILCSAERNAQYLEGSDDGTFTFYTGAHDAKGIISIVDNIGNGYEVTQSGDWFKFDESTGLVTLNSIADYDGGTITITANGSSETHILHVNEVTYNFKLGTLASGLTNTGTTAAPVLTAHGGSNAYNGNVITVTPSEPFAYDSGYDVSDTPSWLNVTPGADNANTFNIAMQANYSDGPRTQEVTLSSKDGSGKTLKFTVSQPKLAYKFVLGELDDKLEKSGTDAAPALTAPSSIGTYTVPFTCSPKYEGSDYELDVPSEAADWLEASAVKAGDNTGTITLQFKTKNTTGTNRSAVVTLKATDGSGSSFDITVGQKTQVLYTFGLGDPGTGFTRSGNTLTAISGDAGTYDDVKITSDPNYTGTYIVEGDDVDWITVTGSNGKLTIELTRYDSNATTADRSRDIIIKSDDGESWLEFTVVQPILKYTLSYKQLSASTKDLFGNDALTYSNNTVGVWYASNKTYTGEVIIDRDGYTGNLTGSGTGFSNVSIDSDGNVTFTIDENTSYSDDATRTLTIAATDDNPNVEPLSLKFSQLKRQILSDVPNNSMAKSNNTSFSFRVANNFGYTYYNKTGSWIITETFTYSAKKGTGNFRSGPSVSDQSQDNMDATITGTTAKNARDWSGGTVIISMNESDCPSLTVYINKQQ